MAEAAPKEIRIYCVCGQKMKISADMFGRKCKCVSCRQRMRVPFGDEIPPGAKEIHLREHPEFLRKPYIGKHRSPKSKDEKRDQKDGFQSIIIPGDFIQPVMDSEGEESEAGFVEKEAEERLIPLDDNRALQELCSLEYKIEKLFSEGDTDDLAITRGLRKRLEQSREKMESKFRERAQKLAQDLERMNGELLRYNDDLRSGELNYTDYRSKVRGLRFQREAVARLRHNLRAWLQVHDPYSAGGYVNVPNEALPTVFPLPQVDGLAPKGEIALNNLLLELRHAFKSRVQADLDLAECQRQCDSGALSGAKLDEARAVATARKARARARVLYARARIAECENDFDRDAIALECNLKIAEEMLRDGEVDDRAFKAMKADLERGQSDNEIARDYARRALSANSAEDVLTAQGTFFERLINTGYVKEMVADRWLGIGAAAAFVITSFLPITPINNNWALAPSFSGGMLTSAVLVALVSLLPNRSARTILFSLLWVVVCLGASFYLHELRYLAGVLGESVREDSRWWVRPGLLGLVASVGLLGAASSLAATSPRRKVPLAPIFSVLAISAGVAAIVANFGGLLDPTLALAAPSKEAVNSQGTLHRVSFGLGNTGVRAVWLVLDSASEPYPVRLNLENGKSGSFGRRPLAMPEAVRRANGDWGAFEEPLALAPGEKVELRYLLEAGEYRFVLESDRLKKLPDAQSFSLEASKTSVPRSDVPPINQNNAPLNAPQSSAPQFAPPAILPHLIVELEGVMNNPESEPIFFLNVSWPDGAQERWSVKLNQVVFGPWRTQEFNPTDNSLTFSNGEALRILKKNDKLSLSLN